jgi:hypothetical protein
MDRYQSSAEKAYPQAANPAEAVLLQMIADGWKSQDLEVDLKVWDDHCLAVSRFDARRKGTGVDEPSDEEVRAEYDNNPMPYAKFGFWMLTRYLVPVGSGESKVGSREEAVKRAEDARKRALEGMSDADIGRIFGQRHGLVIDSTEDWTRTSDLGLADRELVKTPVGGFTNVYSHDGGAMFYRKDEERPIERRPFEEVEEQIRGGKRAGNRDAAFWKIRREAVEARMADVDWDELRRWAEEIVPRP